MLREGKVVLKRTSGLKALRAVACAAALLCMGTGAARADDAATNSGPAATLSARYAALKDELSHNQFHRPLHMDSSERPDGVTGEIFALVNYPFATAGAALNQPSQWCDILILHLNTKYCRPSTDSQGTVLHVIIGKKYDQPVNEAYRVDFVYRVAARTANYLQVKLNADEGPLSTRDYRIVLEATPVEDGQTFIRLSYSYAYGMVGKLAMQVYLGTIGRNKVGFTVVGKEADSQPQSIGGMRGVVERNTMRYYLAIEAFLGALSAPPKARVEKSLRDWFAATESYPRQLHEMEQSEYLDMKRKEYSRQQAEVMK
jgi:hypothetical protein